MPDEDPRKKSCAVYAFIMEMLVDKFKKTKLDLHHLRNNNNLTPLYLSAEKSMPEIMQAIMQTNGVYSFPQKHCGINDYVP